MAKTFIVTASTIAGGFVGWFLGGFDGFLYALIAFVVADYINWAKRNGIQVGPGRGSGAGRTARRSASNTRSASPSRPRG